MSGRTLFLAILGFVVLAAAMNSFFILDQTQQALVLRFGKPVGAPIREPGLQLKVPFVDSVKIYDRRILTLNADQKTVILRDQDRLIVDAYVTYRIKDPLRFYQAVKSERTMNQRLDNMLETALREVLGRENLNTLLSPARSSIMNNIRESVSRLASGQSLRQRSGSAAPEALLERQEDVQAEPATTSTIVDEVALQVGDSVTDDLPAEAVSDTTPEAVASRAGYGIEIVDVRMMRTDLPPETSTPIYNRMRSDRQKVAERFRAEGQKESQIITSEADKERTIMLAEAERKSSVIRGQGDAEATKIFAQAFSKDADFYEFYRALSAYRASLSRDDTTVILSPDHQFLKFLQP